MSCQALTTKNEQCKRGAIDSTDYCKIHQDYKPVKKTTSKKTPKKVEEEPTVKKTTLKKSEEGAVEILREYLDEITKTYVIQETVLRILPNADLVLSDYAEDALDGLSDSDSESNAESEGSYDESGSECSTENDETGSECSEEDSECSDESEKGSIDQIILEKEDKVSKGEWDVAMGFTRNKLNTLIMIRKGTTDINKRWKRIDMDDDNSVLTVQNNRLMVLTSNMHLASLIKKPIENGYCRTDSGFICDAVNTEYEIQCQERNGENVAFKITKK